MRLTAAAAALILVAATATVLLASKDASLTEPAYPDGIPVVSQGKPRAVVVLPDQAGPMNRLAARELVDHIKLSTGAVLPMVTESKLAAEAQASSEKPTLLFVGPTDAARAAGIDLDALGEEDAVLRTGPRGIFVATRREKNHAAASIEQAQVSSGELAGVYEFLDRFAGVRWLWPGKLGTFVPRHTDLVIRAGLDEKIFPVFDFRGMRWDTVRNMVFKGAEYSPEVEQVGFTKSGLRAYGQALSDYMRRHRITGTTNKPKTGHAFSTWWAQYGKVHPEWFMLNSAGQRGPEPGASAFAAKNVAMCVANKDLPRQVVDKHREEWREGGLFRIGESDSRQFCQCEICMVMDPPSPETVPRELEPLYALPITSDRYAHLWSAVDRLAAERDPSRNYTITTFLYVNYLPAPSSGVKLSGRILADFCPFGADAIDSFPMTKTAFEWVKKQWLAWRETGIRLAYRSNHMLKGNFMPYINLRQTADMFQTFYRSGMVGTDFDSLTGQWAVHGPEIYLQARLFNHPEKSVDEILTEYYEAFGPAASSVRSYFDYWEQYTMKLVESGEWERLRRTPSIYRTHELFPPASFEGAEQILTKAQQAVADEKNPEFADRVEFLRLGLEHAKKVAKLSSAFAGQRSIAPGTPEFEQAHEVIADLVAFRKKHEKKFISDFLTPKWDRSAWDMGALIAGHQQEAPVQEDLGDPTATNPALRDTR